MWNETGLCRRRLRRLHRHDFTNRSHKRKTRVSFVEKNTQKIFISPNIILRNCPVDENPRNFNRGRTLTEIRIICMGIFFVDLENKKNIEFLNSRSLSHLAVNACLAPVCSLHGMAVTTVEGIGSTKTRLHPVQERIAKAHGSQCGFCTPGIVMSMYALLRSIPKPTMENLEVAFQGAKSQYFFFKVTKKIFTSARVFNFFN